MPTNASKAVVAQLQPDQSTGLSRREAKRFLCCSSKAEIPRFLPFALFMAFIAVDESARLLAARNALTIPPTALHYLYPVKAATVAALLYIFRGAYEELSFREITRGRNWIFSALIGIATCCLWVCMDWSIPLAKPPAGFDPTLLPAGPVRAIMTSFRVAGAVLVVPLMEELFWRSFLLRYLINADFQSVRMGTFTWGSFLISALLFGLEHHFVFAGVMAGVIYNVVLYKTRSVAQCVLAHAVTNLTLALYVLHTGKWYFW